MAAKFKGFPDFVIYLFSNLGTPENNWFITPFFILFFSQSYLLPHYPLLPGLPLRFQFLFSSPKWDHVRSRCPLLLSSLNSLLANMLNTRISATLQGTDSSPATRILPWSVVSLGPSAICNHRNLKLRTVKALTSYLSPPALLLPVHSIFVKDTVILQATRDGILTTFTAS